MLSYVREFGQRLKRVSEFLGRYQGWGWREWYGEAKLKAEVEMDSGSYHGKFLLGPKLLVANRAQVGVKRWSNVLLEHWSSKKDHRETLDTQNMKERMGLGTEKGGRYGTLVFSQG